MKCLFLAAALFLAACDFKKNKHCKIDSKYDLELYCISGYVFQNGSDGLKPLNKKVQDFYSDYEKQITCYCD